ncbi:hypothetical protein CONPUDRAFT_158802 [Coniophora puteana RWD-64-598 SS2]|uniref:Uncharacterized protein n=1 Tax=Coniophora puteana (strain RWD-64-598) TaxID=741705 RepID=A0A5M3MA06_CONPW|nr:uncharacterized protein CONPUDRAFT_158802 [Coniophora puteana RWD-64-598 SS2]EIW76029.1 hypothetical protein CONPUDRAFT_158802 [Coniophora puteana RWD-64-598 SS2]
MPRAPGAALSIPKPALDAPWWQNHFQPHPLLPTKAGRRIEQSKNQKEYEQGARAHLHSVQEIKDYLWALEPNWRWVQGVADTTLNHMIKHCPHVTTADWDTATTLHSVKKKGKNNQNNFQDEYIPGAGWGFTDYQQSSATGSAPQLVSASSSTSMNTLSINTGSLSVPPSVGNSPSPSVLSIQGLPASPAIDLSLPAVPHWPAGISQSRGPLSRRSSQAVLAPVNPPAPAWTPALQQEFERRILQLTVSAGLPFSWADNPE